MPFFRSIVNNIIPGIGAVWSITFEGGHRWNNFKHVCNAHRAMIIRGMALVVMVVRKWIKSVGKSHGWVKTGGDKAWEGEKEEANHVTVVL